jgi:hypothetical protein
MSIFEMINALKMNPPALGAKIIKIFNKVHILIKSGKILARQ